MDARMDIDGEAGGGGGGGELRPRLLYELGVILAPAGRERGGARPSPAPDPALTAAALDAAGALGATRGGAELLLADEALASALAALALQGTGADLFGRTVFLTIIIALQTRMPAAAYNRGGFCSPYTKPVLTQSEPYPTPAQAAQRRARPRCMRWRPRPARSARAAAARPPRRAPPRWRRAQRTRCAARCFAARRARPARPRRPRRCWPRCGSRMRSCAWRRTGASLVNRWLLLRLLDCMMQPSRTTAVKTALAACASLSEAWARGQDAGAAGAARLGRGRGRRARRPARAPAEPQQRDLPPGLRVALRRPAGAAMALRPLLALRLLLAQKL